MKVKDDLAGKKGICPTCAAKFRIPEKTSTPPTRPAVAGGLPLARVVSLDPLFAASLPAASAIEEADTVGTSAIHTAATDDQPDFVLLPDDEPVVEESATSPSHPALDEQPELAWCVAVRGGAPSAPLAAADMRAWLDSGAATDEHVVWRADWPDWRPIGQVFPDALRPS